MSILTIMGRPGAGKTINFPTGQFVLIAEAETLKESFTEELRYPETAIPLLVELDGHTNPYVRDLVLADPLTPLHVIKRYINRIDEVYSSGTETRITSIVANHYWNGPLMETILNHKDPNVLIQALKNRKFCDKYGDWIMKHRRKSFSILSTYAKYTLDPKHLRKLSRMEEKIKYSIASNENITPDVLYQLAVRNRKNNELLATIGHNTNVDRVTLEYLLTFDHAVIIWAVAQNPKTPADLLHRIATGSKVDSSLAVRLAFNFCASWETLDHLYGLYPTEPGVMVYYMNHKETLTSEKIKKYFTTQTEYPQFWGDIFTQPDDWKHELVALLKLSYPEVTELMPIEWLEDLASTLTPIEWLRNE